MKPHWPNPYNVVYVPIEELAECHGGLGDLCETIDGVRYTLTKEKVLEHWKEYEDIYGKVDAYILPQPSGFHSIGIRYGEADFQYVSPYGNKEKVAALLKRYL